MRVKEMNTANRVIPHRAGEALERAREMQRQGDGHPSLHEHVLRILDLEVSRNVVVSTGR